MPTHKYMLKISCHPIIGTSSGFVGIFCSPRRKSMVTTRVRLSCSWMAVIVIVYEWSCHQRITARHPNTPKQQENSKTQDSKTQIFKSKCCSITSPPVNKRDKTNAMIGFEVVFTLLSWETVSSFLTSLAPGASGLILFPLTKVNTCKIQQSGATLATIRYIYEHSMNLSILQWFLAVAWSWSHFSWSPFRKSPKSMKFLMLLIEVIHLVTANKNPKALDFTRKPQLRDKQTSIMKSKFVEAAVLLSKWKHDFKRRFSNKK